MAIFSKGTIYIKDAAGELIPFLPTTNTDSVKNGNVSLKSKISNLKTRIASAAQKGGIKVMYEMPTAANTATFGKKTFIGAIVSPTSEKVIMIQATLLSGPTNGSFFVLGEEYSIQYELFNCSNVQLDDATLLLNDEEAVSFALDIAESKKLVYVGNISEDDVVYSIESNELLELVADISFDGSDEFTFIGNRSVQLNCIPTDSSYYDPLLSITFQVTSSPSSGSAYNLGDTIRYKTIIANNGHSTFDGPLAITSFNAYDDEIASQFSELEIGQSLTIENSIVVTENDIINRSGWKVSCRVEGTSFLGDEFSISNYRTITIAVANPKLKIDVVSLSSPSDGNAWTNGEDVEYKLVVTNVGNLTLSDIEVHDENSDQTWTISSLAPGAQKEFSNDQTHYQIPLDNEEGIISLNASGIATAPNGYTPTIQAMKLAIITDHNISFRYTVDTTALGTTAATTGMPFLPGAGESIIVVWGDGDATEYSSSDTTRTHTYSSPGEYEILVSCTNWQTATMSTASGAVTSSSNPILYYFRGTLKSINSPFFQIANTSFNYAFYSCTALRTICEGVFQNCRNVTSFSYAFYGCTLLNSIPEGMFDGYSSVSSFAYCFYNCKAISSLPANLFRNCSSVSSFASCFYGCSAITSIDPTIFSGCSAATTFDSAFYSCTNLATIPSGLFADCIGATTFHLVFRNCTKMANIPADLFSTNTLATNFGGVFWSCQNIQSIPEDLLRYNVAATNVGAFFCYAKGPAFANFPVDFLKYNVNVTSLLSDNYGFFEGSDIVSFSLRIGSRNISSASYFCYGLTTSGVTRTIYVPAGSTTKTTMQNIASSFALTIVEE